MNIKSNPSYISCQRILHEFGLVVLEQKNFQKFASILTILLLSLLEKGLALHLYACKCPSPKHALCQVCCSGEEVKMWNVYKQTDRQTTCDQKLSAHDQPRDFQILTMIKAKVLNFMSTLLQCLYQNVHFWLTTSMI